MSLTLNQISERAGCLSGEIKAAVSALSECEAAEREQSRLASIASQATARARERLEALKAERATLAEEAREAVLAKGEAINIGSVSSELADPDHPSAVFGGFHVLQDQLLANGEARMNEALERAREG